VEEGEGVNEGLEVLGLVLVSFEELLAGDGISEI
jgi:hypothetical protein